jgi:hypothetical protein
MDLWQYLVSNPGVVITVAIDVGFPIALCVGVFCAGRGWRVKRPEHSLPAETFPGGQHPSQNNGQTRHRYPSLAAANYPLEPFGKRLRALRVLRERTQYDVAIACGVSCTRISETELGKRRPSDELLESISSILELTNDEITELKRLMRGQRR